MAPVVHSTLATMRALASSTNSFIKVIKGHPYDTATLFICSLDRHNTPPRSTRLNGGSISYRLNAAPIERDAKTGYTEEK